MAVSYSREELGRGISLTRIYDKKFKSNCVKIAFISPLNEKTACVNGMQRYLHEQSLHLHSQGFTAQVSAPTVVP